MAKISPDLVAEVLGVADAYTAEMKARVARIAQAMDPTNPNRHRVRFAPLEEQFAYFTECALATVETFDDRPRFPKYERDRFRSLAANMVQTCKDQKIAPKAGGRPCSRLAEKLEELDT